MYVVNEEGLAYSYGYGVGVGEGGGGVHRHGAGNDLIFTRIIVM